jgi:hypothetical protein
MALLPRQDFLKSAPAKTWSGCESEELLRSWVNIGYEVGNIVITPGPGSPPGGILNIWTPAYRTRCG